MEISKLEVYVSAGQEARVPIVHRAQAGENGCRGGGGGGRGSTCTGRGRGPNVRGYLVRGCRGGVALLRRQCSALLRQNKLG
jgi:hypothetical protein